MKTRILKTILLACLLPLWAMARGEAIRIEHGPYLQDVSENEATIVWTANRPSIGWVELAPDDSSHFYATPRVTVYDTRIGIKRVGRRHVVRLTGLRPGTRYRYRVCVKEVLKHERNQVHYGNNAATDVYTKRPLTFTTSDHARPTVSFVMVNDIHGRNEVLERMISHCDLASTDLFLFNGDMISQYNRDEDLFSGFMDTATRLFASEIPMYYARGNHETRGEAAASFHDYFAPAQDELYYLFRQGPVCFVMLDCGEDKPDSDIEYYGLTAYDDYRSRQAEWISEALRSDLYRTAPYKVVVCHMPPFGSWHGEMDIARKFIPLLNKAKPDVYLCGHLHLYQRNEAGEENVGFPLIVNSNDTFIRAEADSERLTIRVFDLSGKEIDRLVIPKPTR